MIKLVERHHIHHSREKNQDGTNPWNFGTFGAEYLKTFYMTIGAVYFSMDIFNPLSHRAWTVENCCHISDDNFRYIELNENFWIWNIFLLKFDPGGLTHWGWMTHICVCKVDHYWSRWWLVTVYGPGDGLLHVQCDKPLRAPCWFIARNSENH